MEITSAAVRSFLLDGFDSVSNENLRHIKILPCLSVVQAVRGSYDIALGSGETESTGEGGFFIAPANIRQTIVHHVNPESGTMSARWLFLDMAINQSLSPEHFYCFPTVIRDEQKQELNALFDRLFSAKSIWKIHSLCFELMEWLAAAGSPADGAGAVGHPGIRDALAYMSAHRDSPVTVGELAAAARMSESHFYAVFRRQMGIPPIAYLNSCRLTAAAGQLIGSSQSVCRIASAVGIDDPLYFSRMFKKAFGLPPLEYRRTYQKPQN